MIYVTVSIYYIILFPWRFRYAQKCCSAVIKSKMRVGRPFGRFVWNQFSCANVVMTNGGLAGGGRRQGGRKGCRPGRAIWPTTAVAMWNLLSAKWKFAKESQGPLLLVNKVVLMAIDIFCMFWNYIILTLHIYFRHYKTIVIHLSSLDEQKMFFLDLHITLDLPIRWSAA